MTDPTAAELDAICARLTKAQREALTGAWHNKPGGLIISAPLAVRMALVRNGLAATSYGFATPLGVATRKRLIERMNG